MTAREPWCDAREAPLRTPEQMCWIRDRFKPDGLRRLARADRDYADAHGVYLPDVAALAHAEWERAEAAEAVLRQIADDQHVGVWLQRWARAYFADRQPNSQSVPRP